MTTITPTTERASLLRGIHEFPNDDLRRKVFMDWLEENGEVDFAESIRFGLKLAEWIEEKETSLTESKFVDEQWYWFNRSIGHNSEQNRLRLGRSVAPGTFNLHPYGVWNLIQNPVGYFHKGFIQSIHCNREFFFRHAVELFSNHPIQHVKINDYVPIEHEWFENEQTIRGYSVDIFLNKDWQSCYDDYTYAIQLPWTKNHDYVWEIRDTDYGKLSEKVSNYLVDYMRRTVHNLPGLYDNHYPQGRGEWNPLRESEIDYP